MRGRVIFSLLLFSALYQGHGQNGTELIRVDPGTSLNYLNSSSAVRVEDHRLEKRLLFDNLFGNNKKKKKPTTIATAILGGDRTLIGSTLSTLFTEVDSCLGSQNKGWTDADLGDFTISKDSPYCSRVCYRSFFCCAPQKPDELDVKFIFSAVINGRPQHTLISADGSGDTEAVVRLLRNTKNPILWFVHGLINDIYVEPIYNQTRDAMLKRGFHYITVDWHLGNRLYLQSMANVRIVGALTGQLMYFLKAWDRSTCTGFSLGAHICGEAGSYLKRRGKILRKCEGIDPAGPGFDGCANSIRLDRNDCGLVTVMHTSAFKNAGSLAFGQGFGTTLKSGHCDFWANNGLDQPNCDNTTAPGLVKKLFRGMFGKFTQDLEWAWECSHYRAVYYYLSQARKVCNFVGVEGACGGGVACTRDAAADADGRTKKHGVRGRRGIIKSAVKGTLNQLGLRKKKKHKETGEEEEVVFQPEDAAGGREELDQDYEKRRRPGHRGPNRGDGWQESQPQGGEYDDYEGSRRPSGHRRPGGNRRPAHGRPDYNEGGRFEDYDVPDGGQSRPHNGRPHKGGGGHRQPPRRPGGSYDEYDRPMGGGNRPIQGAGDMPDGWDSSGSENSDGSSNGGNFPLQMSISPDDTCKASYDVDYRFTTTGRLPFC